MVMNITEQKEWISDWIFEHEYCSPVDDGFICAWEIETGLLESTLRKRLNEMYTDYRLCRVRVYHEYPRPPGVPRWQYVYS